MNFAYLMGKWIIVAKNKQKQQFINIMQVLHNVKKLKKKFPVCLKSHL